MVKRIGEKIFWGILPMRLIRRRNGIESDADADSILSSRVLVAVAVAVTVAVVLWLWLRLRRRNCMSSERVCGYVAVIVCRRKSVWLCRCGCVAVIVYGCGCVPFLVVAVLAYVLFLAA